MSFIRQVQEAEATGPAAAHYARAIREQGRVMNLHRAFAHLPELAPHFEAMAGALKARMGTRRYELVTLAAALALRSSYCALAHAGVLLQGGMAEDDVAALARGEAPPGLTEAERALMEYARAIVRDAAGIGADAVEGLRGHGFSDAEISEAAATAALRCYFSKVLDALGTEPDAGYRDMRDDLRDALVLGRPIAADGGTAGSAEKPVSPVAESGAG